MNKLKQGYDILEKLKLNNGLFLASTSSDYSYVWLRDSFYISLPYLNKSCNTYENVYYRILDMLIEYEWKLSFHTKQKPVYPHEYIHARYSAKDVKEIDAPWGHSQNDAVGAILWGIGEGIKHGKNILRNDKDKEIVQKLVHYLETLAYWNDEDSGMWEEIREKRSSSIGACYAGLNNVKDIVNVPEFILDKGIMSLISDYGLFPHETATRRHDLAILSLIYPYNIFPQHMAEKLLIQTEEYLVREKGVIRYLGDSYYSTLEEEHGRGRSRSFYIGTEAEWCFGFGFLSLGYSTIGNYEKAEYYLERLENAMLEDGSVPELYYSSSDKYNVNTPLGWGNAMYILAKEKLLDK